MRVLWNNCSDPAFELRRQNGALNPADVMKLLRRFSAARGRG
jgi:hypothetical protein